MIRDLRTILDGWAYEPGRISCRRIIGRDGREKIQTRIDLGVMQFECNGRPDGRTPGGHASLLDGCEQRLREHIDVHGSDEEFVIGPEECRELRHESYLYYQRYLAFYVLEEYDGLARDTVRNLRVIDLCARYAGTEYDRTVLQPQRPYVVMMHTRARVQLALAAGEQELALKVVREGMGEIARFAGECACEGAGTGELRALEELQRDVLAKLPPEAPARLQTELQAALAVEDYETAAVLRDRLRNARRSPARSTARG
ncbi:MAG: UvrB/UvrC motif-containing protein [Planctomycetota bacterium]